MLMSMFRNRIRTSTIKGLFQSIGWFPLLGIIINIMNYNHNLSFILKNVHKRLQSIKVCYTWLGQVLLC